VRGGPIPCGEAFSRNDESGTGIKLLQISPVGFKLEATLRTHVLGPKFWKKFAKQ
jgi:hypothetical protein